VKPCTLCGLEHEGWISCKRAAYVSRPADAQSSIPRPSVSHPVSHPSESVSHQTPAVSHPVSHHSVSHPPPPGESVSHPVVNMVANRHGKHANLDARRAYMRDYMRAKRAARR
jgi:hypothetical protein